MLFTTPQLSRSGRALGCALGCAIALVGCATTLPKEPVATTSITTTAAAAAAAAATTPAAAATVPEARSNEVTTDPVTVCDLVCERAQAVARAADEPDYTSQATANANTVLETMHDDLLACYKKRVAVNPNAHGFITVDIVIDPTGHVRNVETTGGAVLGEGTMGCIVKRIQRASFDPPHGGGTLRIHVPFSLRRVAPGDET
jgi:hypothetical protein